MKAQNNLLARIFGVQPDATPSGAEVQQGAVLTGGNNDSITPSGSSSSSSGSSSSSSGGDVGGCVLGDAPGSLFGIEVFEEKHHWHINKELEPAFWTQAKDDRARLNRKKQEWAALPARKLARFRNLPDALREQLSELLGQAESGPPAEYARLEAQVKHKALRALEGQLFRPLQMERRALEKMVKSLQGGTTFYRTTAVASATPAASAGALPASTDTGINPSTNKGTRGGAGKPKVSKKDAIIAEQTAKKLKEKQEAAQTVWDAADGPAQQAAAALKAADAAASSSRASAASLNAAAGACGAAVAAVDAAARKLHISLSSSSLVAQAAVTKLALLHARLVCQAAAAAQRGASGISTASSSSEWRSTLQQLLLAVSAAANLSPTLQLLAVPLPKSALTVSSKHTVAAPIQAAAAAVAALGYSAEASALLQAAGFDSGSITYKTSKPFAFKPLAESPAGPARAVSITEGPDDSHSTHCVREGPGEGSRILPSWVRLQLELLPHHLRRQSSGAPDPRITGFVPDEWQQQLLDVVDKGSCAVVTAPTSSGKTFISSYVIQQVLKPEASAAAAAAAVGPSGTTDSSRSSNNGKLDRGLSKGSKDVAGADQSGQQLATVAAAACAGPTSEGVVVIVLPTKALVNQLAAQVYNDFGPGVHGVFTRDYRMTPQTCRVLLTVPACLEILMLSPANRNWVESVRWVIFDEVHCISELGGGDIWERLLLAVRCPWLALSATVGNPEAFRAWLQRVKDAQLAADMAAGLVPAAAAAGTCSGGKVIANGSSGSMSDGFRPPRYQVHLIQHKERYNELLAQVFVPQHNSPRPRSPAGQCGTATGAPAATQQCGTATGAPAATQHHSGSTRRQTSQISGPIWTLSSSRNSAAAVAASKSSAAAGASSGPHSSSGKGRLVALHPAASVSLQQLAAPAAAGGGWPCELPLAPDEALQLYDALLASVKALYRQQTQQGADQENATNEQAGGSADEGVLAEMQLQLQQLAPERMQVLPEVFPVPVSVVSGGTTQSNSGSKKKGSSQVSSSSSAAIPTAAAAAAAMAAGQTAGRPSEVFLSKPAAKAWAAQLVQLLEQWARAEPGTPAATSSTCDLAADTSSTRQLGALVVPGNAASTPAATSEALSTGDPAASLAASVVAMALQRLGSASATAMAADEAAWQQQHPTEPCFDWAYQRQHLLDLILSLRQAGELPAILFNFERGLCMAYAGLLCDALGDAEGRWREQHARELQAERAKLDFGDRSADGGHDDHSSSSGGRSRQRGKAAGGADGGGAGGGSSSSGVDLRTVAVGGVVASADEELPDPSFTLLSYDKARSQDLWDTIADLRADGTDPDLLQALARGIGVHHSGLDTRYRQAVEMLFRSKHLQVVVATGTLAYGIHMPCRAVVMAGDSPFLDALNFRQMSGRAGRRGLDNVGHVVFFSLPKHRIDALRVSQLPRLRGTMLPNPCLLLRMLLLHQQLSSRHADKTKGATGRGLLQLQPVAATSGPTGYQLSSATSSLLTLAAEPFLAAADPTARQQLEHMMEFGLVYLAASHLIDAAGRPVGLAGLVSHLFWTDPANFALARLLSSGAVHRLVAECKGQQQVQEALLLVVAGLFERLPLHPLEAQRWLGSKRNESPSVVVLPSLPASVSAIIEQHNDHVLQLLVSTLKQRMTPPTAAVCSPGSSNCGQTLDPNLLYQQECSLPLSGCRYAITPHSDGTGGSPSTIRQRLAASAVPAVVASPFMALCGAGDEFGSLSELLLAGRQGLRLHRNGVPLMAVQDRRGRQLDMNAWAWDYFKHGSKSELVRANGMLEGDAWARLKSFSGVLAAISTSLQQATLAGDTQSAAAGGIDPGSNMSVADAFSSLAEAFNMRFRGFNTGGVVVQHGAAHVGRQR